MVAGMGSGSNSEDLQDVAIKISGDDLVFVRSIGEALAIDPEDAAQRLVDRILKRTENTVGEAAIAVLRASGVEPSLELKKLAFRRRAWNAYIAARRTGVKSPQLR